MPGILLAMGSFLVAADPPQGHHDHGADETVAHPHDPVLQAEHTDMLSLVPRAAATHTALGDGRWSDQATWKDRKLPTADAAVLIPKGTTVIVDEVLSVSLRTLRVDGKLEFAPDRDTCVVVDTIVVAPGGELIVGTVQAPVARDRRARIIFADRGPIDTRWDPTLLSRGLIAHGSVSLVGTEVTPHVALARAPQKGDTKLVLAQAPVNWKKGDRLILTGTAGAPGKDGRTQDEELAILGVSGPEVNVRALEFDHTAPKEGLTAYVGNLTRNVRLESQNQKPDELGRHGHVMFMHSPRVQISYAGFYDLGRTDKRIAVNDPRLDEQKKLRAGTGTNPRGRYPVHFHRTGADLQTPAIPVKGCAVVNSPGWGYVNHSSHVAFEDNVAYNIHGAAFVTEAGDEVGSFRRNLAVRSIGSGQDTVARNDIQDFGHEGSGFWLQGGGVTVEDNIAAGHRDAAYFFFTSGLIEEGLGRRGFLVSNVPEKLRANNLKSPKEKQPADRMTLNYLPLLSCKGNTAFASGLGMVIRFHSPPVTESVVEDCTVWRTDTGIRILYSDNIRLKNLRLIGDGKNARAGIDQASEAIGATVYENLHVQGWTTGLAVSDIVAKNQVIQGGYYDNDVNIALALAYTRDGTGRVDEIKGAIRFGPNSKRDIALKVYYDAFYTRDPNVLFFPNVVRIDTEKYPKQQLYYPDQGADYVPLKTEASGKFRSSAKGHVPDELIDKTNRELWEKYSLAVAGGVAPTGARTEPKIEGLVGEPSAYRPGLVLHNIFSPKLEGYRPNCTAAGQASKTTSAARPVDLRRGWNLVTQKSNDEVRSFLVFGGADRPGGTNKKGAYPKVEEPRSKEPPKTDAKPEPWGSAVGRRHLVNR
jgi:hypothetical protein